MNVFKQRWFVSLLGVVFLSLIIWFVGPLLGFAGTLPLASAIVRGVFIALLFLGWAGSVAFRRWRSAQAGSELTGGLDDLDEGHGQQAREAEILDQRFQEGLEVLKRYRGADGRKHSLLDIPWYVIIGPPGAGKTTALVNSGLHFPLADRFGKEALQGVGGTRNCDWWFTDEAVLLDTAGRYVLQDSDASADSAGWQTFLDKLKHYRKRRPINGVMVAISVLDLMTLSERERTEHIRAIRSRISELNRRLNIRFPVYVLLTKFDLVAGFVEFFDDLGREERNQIWGVTFPYSEDPADAIARFETEFDALLGRLNDRLFWRLHNERDPRRRALINGFPPQLASLRQTIDDFLKGVFAPNRYDEPVLLRGVYFTSGTQEGTAIDRVLGALANAFGVSVQAQGAFSGQGRSYFLTRLLHDVIFAEAGLAGTSQKVERRRRWMQRAALAAALVLTLGLAAVWSTSFTGNLNLLEETRTRLDGYADVAGEPLDDPVEHIEGLVKRLDAVEAVPEVYADHLENGIPVSLAFGLYQGRKIGGAGGRAYRRLLLEEFMPTLATRIERILGASADDLDTTYEVFKLYLMLGEPERLEPDLLRLVTDLDWKREWPQDPEFRGRLEHHLNRALETGIDPVHLNDELVASIRETLNELTPAELVYGRLTREYAADDNDPFALSEALGKYGDEVFQRKSRKPIGEAKIPALYTKEGFTRGYLVAGKQLSKKLKDEAWVLARPESELSRAETEALSASLEKLYTRDFVRHWDGMIDDLEMKPFAGIQKASERTDLLSGKRSPLRQLLREIRKNTDLLDVPDVVGELAGEAAQRAGGRLGDKLKDLFRNDEGGSASALKGDLPGSGIAEHFEELADIVKREEGYDAPYEEIADVLAQLSAALNLLALGEGDGKQTTAIAQRLRILANRQPEPVQSWLKQVAQISHGEVRRDTVTTTRKQVGSAMADVVSTCQRAIEGRYPLAPRARQSAALADFERFFGPGGLMESFFNESLARYVDKSTSPWRWKAVEGVQVSTSPQTLKSFEIAERIRKTYFAGGGLGAAFTLKPVSLDSRVKEVLLDIGGQRVVYRHGPVRSIPASWPSPEGGLTVRVLFIDASGRQFSMSEDGPWAWMRMLDRARVSRVADDRYSVAFWHGPYKAVFEMRASSVINPFLVKGLEEFSCPEKL